MTDCWFCTRLQPNCQLKQFCFNKFGRFLEHPRRNSPRSFFGENRPTVQEKLEIDRTRRTRYPATPAICLTEVLGSLENNRFTGEFACIAGLA
jgi:hypothetical protein